MMVERQTSIEPTKTAPTVGSYKHYLNNFRSMPIDKFFPHADLYLKSHLNPRMPQTNPNFYDAMELVKIERSDEMHKYNKGKRALERDAQSVTVKVRKILPLDYIPTEDDLHNVDVDLTQLGYVWGCPEDKGKSLKTALEISELWFKPNVCSA